MKIKLFIFFLLSAFMLSAQADSTAVPPKTKTKKQHKYPLPDPMPFATTITAADLKPLVDTLSGPAMQGRETGEEGQRKAADFIAAQFKALGLPPVGDRNTYFQQISLQNESWKDIGLKIGEKEFKNRTDFYVFPAFNSHNPKLELKEVVFVGYGIEDPKYNDYGDADVKGKAVIFYDGEPMGDNGKSLITGSEFRSSWSLDWKRKVQLAKKKGAVMAFIVDTQFAENQKSNRKLTSTWGWKPVSSMSEKQATDLINNLFVSPAVAAAILGKKAEKADDAIAALKSGKEFKPVKVKSKIEVRFDKEVKKLQGSNVIGFIEGADSVLKKEYVFVTAHYDHLGMSDSTVIYHGADDNASGTSGVIEIARAFAEAKKMGIGPKRSVVCMLVSGEEKGLLGSRFYVEYPIFPLVNTIVDINIDMIGRIDDLHRGNPDYIYVIGSDRLSTELHRINEDVNQRFVKLELDYKYNAIDDPNRFYERSDHYNFAERGIPAIFYFNGTHADYHKPTDTADKINFDALAKRAQLAFCTAWDIANRSTRIYADKMPDKTKKD
jgi:hypothetical protein